MALLATLRHLGTFAFGSGGLPEAVAWIWLAVYVALPPLLLAAFVLRERAGGSREYGGGLPALAATRLALGGAGIGLGAVGIGLLTEWSALTERWPWPLPSLPAGVLGGWRRCSPCSALPRTRRNGGSGPRQRACPYNNPPVNRASARGSFGYGSGVSVPLPYT